MRAHGLADCVIVLGQRNDVPLLLQACDMFVFPSHSEGFGIALLEAMAAEKPVVAFALPPFMEFVEPSCGRLVVPLADEEAFVEAVLELLRDPERMMKMGQNGRRIVENRFNIRERAEKLMAVYRGMVKPKRARPKRLSSS